MKLHTVLMNKEYTVIFVIFYAQNDFLKIILNRKLILIIFVENLIYINTSFYCDVCDETIKLKSKYKHFI